MSTELSVYVPETLPDHITFGLADSASGDIDSYAADAQERLDEATPSYEADSEVVDLVAEALPYELNENDFAEIERQGARMRVIAKEKRKRQFGKPVLSLGIIYPKPRY